MSTNIQETFWIFKVWISILFLGLLTSCASAEIADLDLPLAEVKSATQTYFGNNLKSDDDTGREYLSEYFRPGLTKGRVDWSRTEDEVRARARVRFVGNERPYKIIVWVETETKEEGTWRSSGTDSGLSLQVSRALSEFIRTRRDKNVIDHYRPF